MKKADYKNWIPDLMIYGFGIAAVIFLAAMIALFEFTRLRLLPVFLLCVGIGCGLWTAWCIYAKGQFSYEGKRKLSKQIIEGTAAHVAIPDGGLCLDVGCGSGALAIACAKRNPQAKVIGIDHWGPEYIEFSKKLCMENAEAENCLNTEFAYGDANKLDFADETFDAVVSNYVYHNVVGKNKQDLLKETLRVLKKGGSFAIHDLMGKNRYGDMDAFVRELKAQGYERVELIDTTKGMFMDQKEARMMFLADSRLLVGKK